MSLVHRTELQKSRQMTINPTPEDTTSDQTIHYWESHFAWGSTWVMFVSSLGWNNRITVYQGRILCKLNDLPPSTLNTTPYLLHTRAFLILPESHSQHTTSAPSAEDNARETRVRAQIALQRVTKETDWGVAQAYVALAEDSDLEPDITSLKFEGEKPGSGSEKVRRRGTTLEERAVDLYLDDDEWERMNMNTRPRV
jgi:hypothetical protein